jgi:hypothetical protein
MAGLTILVLYVAATPAAPSVAQTLPAGCPTALSPFGTTFEPMAIGNPNIRPADRNEDGVICGLRVRLTSEALLTVLTDNAILGPNTIPPGPCTGRFDPVRAGIGDPHLIGNPLLREIDANEDGALCGIIIHDHQDDTLILVDNPNQPRTAVGR